MLSTILIVCNIKNRQSKFLRILFLDI